jgi:uncharacterized repeat protein (TIGR01451 family)
MQSQHPIARASHRAPLWSSCILYPRKPGASFHIRLIGLAMLACACAGPANAALSVPSLQGAVLRQSVRAQSSQTQATQGIAPASVQLQVVAGIEVHELVLEPNLTLIPWSRLQLEGTTTYEGALANRPGSWVRLTRIGANWVGMWFDGTRYFGLDRAGALSAANTLAASMPNDAPVVFRIEDAQLNGTSFANDIALTGTAAMDPIMAAAVAAAVLPNKRVTVALIADAELVTQDGVNTQSNMLARLNIVDGIFATQVGVRVQSASTTLLSAVDQTFTGTTPATLLDQLKAYRVATTLQQAAGISHLMTGRNLDGQTVGIAFLTSVCDRQFSDSLSEARNSVNFDALIAAHEMGHVFGAPHDGDSAAACGAAPAGMLMAPQLNGSSTFSTCSLEQIAPVVARAQCLATVDASDAALHAALIANLALGQPTTISVSVQSEGNATANNVVFTADLPAGIAIAGVNVVGGTCTITGQQARCDLGALAPGAMRDVQLSLTSSVSANRTAVLRLTADNDSLFGNNRSDVQLVTSPGSDISVTATAGAQTLLVGDNTTATITVRNLGDTDATDVQLNIAVPAGLTLTDVTATGISCSLNVAAVACTPSALAANASATVVLALRAASPGTATTTASAQSSRVDPNPADNQAQLVLAVNSPPAPPPPVAANSGGGGELGVELLLLLAMFRRKNTAADRLRKTRSVSIR